MNKLLIGIALAAVTAVTVIANANGDKGIEQIRTDDRLTVATFAGGCFWCVESDFEQVPGVVDAVSGYTGGSTEQPTYKQVSAGGTGHLESVEVYYDPSVISYEGLLAAFWRMIDPTDDGVSPRFVVTCKKAKPNRSLATVDTLDAFRAVKPAKTLCPDCTRLWPPFCKLGFNTRDPR